MRARARFILAASVALAGTPLLPAVELTGPPAGLLQVRRSYVDLLSGGEVGEQMRDMLIAAIQNTGLFAVTDNPERADAVLKGSTDEQVFTDEHHTTDSLGFHVSDGNGSSSRAILGAATSNQSNRSAGLTQNETSIIKERRQDARASVRMINSDGDIIWAAMMESGGGKFRGAMVDVAEKIARKLTEDTKRLRETAAAVSTTRPAPAK